MHRPAAKLKITNVRTQQVSADTLPSRHGKDISKYLLVSLISLAYNYELKVVLQLGFVLFI
jgi:hypothetical protein